MCGMDQTEFQALPATFTCCVCAVEAEEAGKQADKKGLHSRWRKLACTSPNISQVQVAFGGVIKKGQLHRGVGRGHTKLEAGSRRVIKVKS